jgi:DNA mismatch repair protein MutS2
VGIQGKVVAVAGESLEVMLGGLRVRADLEDVSLRDTQGAPTPIRPAPAPPPVTEHRAPGMELNLRGMTVDEALTDLDRYLDSAFLARLPFVRIIHGKGTGRLRTAIREALRAHSLVTAIQEAGEAEGGEGVTIARLAS